MSAWVEDIINAMQELGGLTTYADLYEKIESIRADNLTPRWRDTVRRTIQYNSSDSASFKGSDLFYSVNGIGKGVWGLRDYIPTKDNVDLTEDDIEFPEGKKKLRKHILRERNPQLVLEAKKLFKQKNNGKLFCEVCEFAFSDKYGKIGNGFIEAHHIIPVSDLEENSKTKISDLIMVCSNCHRMLHRRRPWLTKEDLKLLLIS
jgi:putative restriction endonuclease